MEHRVVYPHLAPFFRVRAPAIFQDGARLVDDVVGKAPDVLGQLVLDDLGVHGVLDPVRVEEGVLGLQELPVHLILAQNVVWLL